MDVRHADIGWLELSFEVVVRYLFLACPGTFHGKTSGEKACLCWKSWCCPSGRDLRVPLSPSAPVPVGSAPPFTPVHPPWPQHSPAEAGHLGQCLPATSVGGPMTARTLLNTYGGKYMIFLARQFEEKSFVWSWNLRCGWPWILLDKEVAKKGHNHSICFYFNQTIECWKPLNVWEILLVECSCIMTSHKKPPGDWRCD